MALLSSGGASAGLAVFLLPNVWILASVGHMTRRFLSVNFMLSQMRPAEVPVILGKNDVKFL